jgi:hypothetical protein
MALLANIIVAFVPVLVFLGVLVVMDSFKLARPSAIATALGWGVAAAVLSSLAQLAMTGTLAEGAFHRVVAPAIEEVAKCAFIAYLILRRRIGFPLTPRSSDLRSGRALQWSRTSNIYACCLVQASCCGWCAGSARRCCMERRPRSSRWCRRRRPIVIAIVVE